MARCPQCVPMRDDAPLVHAMLEEGLPAYSCGKCLGTLVSLVSYRAWRESAAGRHALQGITAAAPDLDAADSIAAKNCPKCRSVMSKYRFSAGKTNRLDYCPHCEEIWLDEGEWRLVESLVATGEFSKVFTQAWQFALRGEITGAMHEQRLRELLGADYERVHQFGEWLKSQPARQEILARLVRGPH
jgi:Zn-finger nucleic acid-binding protein